VVKVDVFGLEVVLRPVCTEFAADPGLFESTPTPADGGWLLNGEKWFVTCGDVADFLLV
jgi:alkylation response protein AidB-like acyl-CoA dehydrogenase